MELSESTYYADPKKIRGRNKKNGTLISEARSSRFELSMRRLATECFCIT